MSVRPCIDLAPVQEDHSVTVIHAYRLVCVCIATANTPCRAIFIEAKFPSMISLTYTYTEEQRQYAGRLAATSVRGECYVRLINTT